MQFPQDYHGNCPSQRFDIEAISLHLLLTKRHHQVHVSPWIVLKTEPLIPYVIAKQCQSRSNLHAGDYRTPPRSIRNDPHTENCCTKRRHLIYTEHLCYNNSVFPPHFNNWITWTSIPSSPGPTQYCEGWVRKLYSSWARLCGTSISSLISPHLTCSLALLLSAAISYLSRCTNSITCICSSIVPRHFDQIYAWIGIVPHCFFLRINYFHPHQRHESPVTWYVL